MDGTALAEAKRRKENRYSDVVRSRRCHLITAGVETGGRWDKPLANFIRQLAKAKARCAPKLSQLAAWTWWLRRWTGMRAVATQDAFANSLVQEVMDTWLPDGDGPDYGSLVDMV